MEVLASLYIIYEDFKSAFYSLIFTVYGYQIDLSIYPNSTVNVRIIFFNSAHVHNIDEHLNNIMKLITGTVNTNIMVTHIEYTKKKIIKFKKK